MNISEFIEILGKYPQDLPVVMLSELNGQYVRVKAEPRHIRVSDPAVSKLYQTVKGVWNPRFHRKEEKGAEVLILW